MNSILRAFLLHVKLNLVENFARGRELEKKGPVEKMELVKLSVELNNSDAV